MLYMGGSRHQYATIVEKEKSCQDQVRMLHNMESERQMENRNGQRIRETRERGRKYR